MDEIIQGQQDENNRLDHHIDKKHLFIQFMKEHKNQNSTKPRQGSGAYQFSHLCGKIPVHVIGQA